MKTCPNEIDMWFVSILVLKKAKKIITNEDNMLIKDGKQWVIKNYEEWSKEFYFFPKLWVVKSLKNLVKNGMLICKSNWYTLGDF